MTAPLQWHKEIPVSGHYDVVVCGGGAAGVPAALSARRAGFSVLLIDSMGQLGGTGTSGLVAHWLGGRTADGRWVVGGLFKYMAKQAAERGFAVIPTQQPGERYQPHGWFMGLVHGIPYDPHAMAAYLDELITSAGIDLLLCTQAIDVITNENRISHVIIANKSGVSAVPASAVIDATGDADIAARSGCDVIKGREEDGLMTPTTLEFIVDNVDQDALSAYIHEHDTPRLKDEIRKLREAGEWPFPYEIFISVQLDRKGVMMINTPRLCGFDGTDGRSVTDGMIQGRAEVMQLFDIMRKHFRGFENARIAAVAPMLGVRETRRIRGEYVLTVNDLTSGALFPDTIGLSAYGWDLPDPKRPSYQPMNEGGVRKMEFTPIPYRIMVPRPVTNLLCPGRAVSVERDVLGPLRVMAPCFAMGEAAGMAAAQMIGRKLAASAVDTGQLRSDLIARGAVIDPEMVKSD